MRFELVGHLGVLVFGQYGVVDELAPCAVLVELGGAVTQRTGLPELGADGLVLGQHLALFEQLGEEDVERADRHDHHHAEDEPGDEAALFHGFEKTERVLRGCVSGSCKKFEGHNEWSF